MPQKKYAPIHFISLLFRTAKPCADIDNEEHTAAVEALDDVLQRYESWASREEGRRGKPAVILISVEMQAVLSNMSVAQLAEQKSIKDLDPLFNALGSLIEHEYGHTVSRNVPGMFLYDGIPLVAVDELSGNSCSVFGPL